MTDLSKGIVEIDNFEIGPDTTQDKFEQHFKNRFLKSVNKYNNSISTFYYNGYAGLFADFDDSVHTTIQINGMTFINIVVDFENEKIRGIQLISNLQSYAIGARGEKIYSPQKEKECYDVLLDWAIVCHGTPNNNRNHSSTSWNFGWGCFRPTPCSPHGASTNVLLVEYGKDYRA